MPNKKKCRLFNGQSAYSSEGENRLIVSFGRIDYPPADDGVVLIEGHGLAGHDGALGAVELDMGSGFPC